MISNRALSLALPCVLMAGVALLVYYGIYLAWTDADYYHTVYAREDGLIEWLTFAAFAAGAAVVFGRLAAVRLRKGAWFAVCTLVLLGCFVLAAGEEISWGQRVFGIASPAFFRKHNLQGELNVHNLTVGGVNVNKTLVSLPLLIALPVYMFLLPVLNARVGWCQSLLTRCAVPLPRLSIQIWLLHCLSLIFAFAVPRIWELNELVLGAAALLIVWSPLNADIYELPKENAVLDFGARE